MLSFISPPSFDLQAGDSLGLFARDVPNVLCEAPDVPFTISRTIPAVAPELISWFLNDNGTRSAGTSGVFIDVRFYSHFQRLCIDSTNCKPTTSSLTPL